MLRDATHEPLIKRMVMLQLDDEGVLHLHEEEVLAGLREGDALGIPGPPPTCETCWTEAAVAITLFLLVMAALMIPGGIAEGRPAGAQLVPILSC